MTEKERELAEFIRRTARMEEAMEGASSALSIIANQILDKGEGEGNDPGNFYGATYWMLELISKELKCATEVTP